MQYNFWEIPRKRNKLAREKKETAVVCRQINSLHEIRFDEEFPWLFDQKSNCHLVIEHLCQEKPLPLVFEG